MTSAQGSCGPNKIKVLAFDFDKTCTKKAILDIYKAREDYKNADEYKAKVLNEEWERIEKFYSDVMEKILRNLKEPKPMQPRFDEDGLRRFLKEVQVADSLAFDEVVNSNIFKGVTSAGIKDFADKVELMPGLLNVLQSLKILNLPFHVISLNFSEKLVMNVLNRGGSLPLTLHTNRLVFKNEVCTGNIDKRFVSAFDKEIELREIIQSANEKCGVTIYIGDSYTDLLALLEVDIGIIIGDSKSIIKVCSDFGIHIAPLHDYARFAGKSNYGLQQVLFSVNSWEEIREFIFTFEKSLLNV